MTPDDVLQLANRLSDKIMARRPDVQEAVRYFRGQEGRMRFASDEFRDYFAKRFVGFSDNWCMPVAQAPIERIHYLGMRLPDARELDSPGDELVPLPQRGAWGADPDLARTWERNDAQRGLNEALLMMTIAKRAYALVSPSSAGARITFENPDSSAVAYDGATGRRRAGMTVWEDDTAEYAQLLLPNAVVPLVREKTTVEAGDRRVPPDVTGWSFGAADVQSHKLGAVPLVEFRNQSLLDNDPISDIGLVMPMQDSINLVWAYQLNGLDYASLPGRVILNGEMPKEDILDQDTGEKIAERPMELDALIRDRIAWLEGQDVKIDEWKPGSLGEFSNVIEQAVAHIAAQTRTPSHYLIASSSANVPAAGYELAEAGLVSKASERISYADAPVREVNRLAALAEGDTARAERIALGKVLWKKPQYRSEAQLMDGLQKMRTTGFPMRWIAEEYGLSPSEVERVMDMIREEQADPTLERLSRDAAAFTSGA